MKGETVANHDELMSNFFAQVLPTLAFILFMSYDLFDTIFDSNSPMHSPVVAQPPNYVMMVWPII
jgi:hypothetical protein